MAKSARDELFETLRARGLRRRAAKVLSEAAGAGRSGAGRSQDLARTMLADLRKAADEVEGRITGKASSRSEAAKKAARTRDRNAKARSTAAKKAAATRKAKAAGGSSKTAGAKRTSTARSTASGAAKRTRRSAAKKS